MLAITFQGWKSNLHENFYIYVIQNGLFLGSESEFPNEPNVGFDYWVKTFFVILRHFGKNLMQNHTPNLFLQLTNWLKPHSNQSQFVKNLLNKNDW